MQMKIAQLNVALNSNYLNQNIYEYRWMSHYYDVLTVVWQFLYKDYVKKGI